MTTDNKEDLVAQEQEAVESQAADPQDWKARFEESEASRLKTENDLKAERGRTKRDDMIRELVEDHGATRQMVTALMNRTASGETEALAGDVATISQTAAAQQATRQWDTNYAEAEVALGEAVMNDAREVVLSKEDIETITPLWQEARAAQDVGGLYRLINRANKMVREAEKAAVQDEAKEAKKVSDRKHGVNDLSLPTPAGAGAGVKSWAAAQKITSLDDMTDAEYDAIVAAG